MQLKDQLLALPPTDDAWPTHTHGHEGEIEGEWERELSLWDPRNASAACLTYSTYSVQDRIIQ